MSNDLPRLTALIRRDLTRVSPIITTSRLDDLTRLAAQWRRVGLPKTSMGGGSGHNSGPTDPTGQDATSDDPGNDFHRDLTDTLDGLARHLRRLIQLDMQAPATPTTCDCGRPLTADARAGKCGTCRRRNRRHHAA